MDLQGKQIGIWGFGIVGKAVAKALQGKCTLSVYDQRQLNQDEAALLQEKGITLYPTDTLADFLAQNDFIIPSPGVDLRPFQAFKEKYIPELDIFALSCKAPIIAITGTVGKTTTTSLLAHVLEHIGYTVGVGGNIGVGMLDLLQDDQSYDYVILEVSSFQLELSKFFSPHIAIWTNFFPNHLDRHDTVSDYFSAKETLLAHQKKSDYSVLPFEIIDLMQRETSAQRFFFTSYPLAEHEYKKLLPDDKLLSFEKDDVVLHYQNQTHILAGVRDLPTVTYQQNILAVISALTILNIPIEQLGGSTTTFTNQEHRLEKVTTINGVDFYNDSKSTITQSTVAAIEKLQGKPILLLLGGLSKGVDRSSLFQQIRNRVTEVFCFGKEAHDLYKSAMAAEIVCHRFDHLEAALQAAVINAKPGDQVLFSPAGSSFDLFSNYQERGKKFKELVALYQS